MTLSLEAVREISIGAVVIKINIGSFSSIVIPGEQDWDKNENWLDIKVTFPILCSGQWWF